MFINAVPYLKSADYNLIGFNLERVTELMPILLDCGIAPDQPTLIVTEFVLPYLNKDRLNIYINLYCIYIQSNLVKTNTVNKNFRLIKIFQ